MYKLCIQHATTVLTQSAPSGFTLSLLLGGVPKRSTGADCKSAGSAFVGSNPTPSTRGRRNSGPGGGPGGRSSMVEPQLSKLMMAVRSRSPAPDDPGLDMAHIAQSVEHFLGKEEVTGSNPVMGSS